MIALGYLLDEQEVVYAVTNTICCIQINISGRIENHLLYRITEQATWLKKERDL